MEPDIPKLIYPTTPSIDIDTFFNDASFDDYSDFRIILKGIFAEFDTRNSNNHRIYQLHIFEEHFERLNNNITNLQDNGS